MAATKTPVKAPRLTVVELQREVAFLRQRLEVDPHHPYDGIHCRDETIRLLDQEVDRLRAMLKSVATLAATRPQKRWAKALRLICDQPEPVHCGATAAAADAPVKVRAGNTP